MGIFSKVFRRRNPPEKQRAVRFRMAKLSETAEAVTFGMNYMIKHLAKLEAESEERLKELAKAMREKAEKLRALNTFITEESRIFQIERDLMLRRTAPELRKQLRREFLALSRLQLNVMRAAEAELKEIHPARRKVIINSTEAIRRLVLEMEKQIKKIEEEERLQLENLRKLARILSNEQKIGRQIVMTIIPEERKVLDKVIDEIEKEQAELNKELKELEAMSKLDIFEERIAWRPPPELLPPRE